MSFEEPRQPEGIVSCLVAELDRWLFAAELGVAITGHPQLGHQAFAVAAFDRIDARLLAVGKLDAQQPRVLTQLQRTEEIIDPRCGCNNLIHCSCLLLRPPTLGGTWTKETVGRLGQAFVPPIASDDSRLQGALPILDSCSAANRVRCDLRVIRSPRQPGQARQAV